MKKRNFLYYTGLLLIGIFYLSSCKKDSGSVTTVYMPGADKPKGELFEITDTPHEIEFMATVVGADYPTNSLTSSNEIEVKFKAEPSLASSFNEVAGTSYTLLPEGSYSFNETGTIAKGSSSTSGLKLKINAKGKLEAFKTYILPISIAEAKGGVVAAFQKTTYFVLTPTSGVNDLQPFDRSAWTIHGFSTEEANGEGPNNGHGFHVIDNDGGTFWHSQWQGNEPAPPHWIAIDMHESKLIHGLILLPRDHWQGMPTSITIEISEDGTTWKNAGTIDNLPTSHEEHRMLLPSMLTGRYFKVIVNSTSSNTNSTHLAEVWAL